MELYAELTLPYPMVITKRSSKIYTLNVATTDSKGFMKRKAKTSFDEAVVPIVECLSELRLSKLHLVCRFYYRTRARRDLDNNIYVLKFLNDLLVKQGIVPDDSMQYLSFVFRAGYYGADKDHVKVKIYGEQ